MTPEQIKLAEQMQDELHAKVEDAMKDGKTSYQDFTNVFLMMKIAELQQRVDELTFLNKIQLL